MFCRIKYLLSFCSLLFLLSCSSKHTSKDDQSEIIQLEKTGCLENCQSYKILIYRNGHVNFLGIANVQNIGEYSRNLNKEEKESFWRLVNADTLVKMQGSYNYGAEDTQQQFLKYYDKGKLIKEIRYGPFPPKYLQRLDSAFQAISEANDWKKAE